MIPDEALYDVINRRRDTRAEFTGGPVDPESLPYTHPVTEINR